jgi:type IV pilus assembly protein PilF
VALTNAGICLREQGRLGESSERLQKAVARNTRFGPALLALARLHQDQRQAQEAQAYIGRYFEVAAPDPESLLLAYQIEQSLGHTRAAESYALMLRSRFPDSPQAYRLPGL